LRRETRNQVRNFFNKHHEDGYYCGGKPLTFWERLQGPPPPEFVPAELKEQMILMALGICGTPEWTKTSDLLSKLEKWSRKADAILRLEENQRRNEELCLAPGCEEAEISKFLYRSDEGFTNSKYTAFLEKRLDKAEMEHKNHKGASAYALRRRESLQGF
jgi:hypothetical protein